MQVKTLVVVALAFPAVAIAGKTYNTDPYTPNYVPITITPGSGGGMKTYTPNTTQSSGTLPTYQPSGGGLQTYTPQFSTGPQAPVTYTPSGPTFTTNRR